MKNSGIQTTLYNIRQKFWLLNEWNQVRKVRSCMRCFCFNADAVNYKMGDLSKARISEAILFTYTGVDFCGSFYIKEKTQKLKSHQDVRLRVRLHGNKGSP